MKAIVVDGWPQAHARMVTRRSFGWLSVIIVSTPAAMRACAVCNSEIGRQVRAGIFDQNFWPTLIAVAAPFPVLLLGLIAFEIGFPFRSGSKERPTTDR